ncbi:hypothetical protein RJ641_023493 [Dillenia turbinata]|uniref:EF-hand domain-containing protein n=1 Tax=Dillenia turbinata TaxID=194707 RepID=A0AAN8YSU7_9MAGN
MAEGGLTVLDGTTLKSISISLPESQNSITGAELLELADCKASSSLFGLSLPETIKSSSLGRINIDDDVNFSCTVLDRDRASDFLQHYISAISDQLKDDPLVVAVLDGKTLNVFFEDEDDFAMLAENLFTDLDVEDKGKIHRKEIRNALIQMGVEMGIPPFSEYPLLNDIIKKHGADEEGELGQAQFAQLLQPILQDLANALAEKHVVVVQNIKIANGSKLRKLLADEKQLNNIIEKTRLEMNIGEDGQEMTDVITVFLQKNGKELGLPPMEANEAAVLLYEAIFADLDKGKNDGKLNKDEFGILVKDILEKFAEQLEANPILHDN